MADTFKFTVAGDWPSLLPPSHYCQPRYRHDIESTNIANFVLASTLIYSGSIVGAIGCGYFSGPPKGNFLARPSYWFVICCSFLGCAASLAGLMLIPLTSGTPQLIVGMVACTLAQRLWYHQRPHVDTTRIRRLQILGSIVGLGCAAAVMYYGPKHIACFTIREVAVATKQRDAVAFLCTTAGLIGVSFIVIRVSEAVLARAVLDHTVSTAEATLARAAHVGDVEAAAPAPAVASLSLAPATHLPKFSRCRHHAIATLGPWYPNGLPGAAVLMLKSYGASTTHEAAYQAQVHAMMHRAHHRAMTRASADGSVASARIPPTQTLRQDSTAAGALAVLPDAEAAGGPMTETSLAQHPPRHARKSSLERAAELARHIRRSPARKAMVSAALSAPPPAYKAFERWHSPAYAFEAGILASACVVILRVLCDQYRAVADNAPTYSSTVSGLIVMLLVVAWWWQHSLSAALRLFASVYFTPLYQLVFTMVTMIAGVFVFDDFVYMTNTDVLLYSAAVFGVACSILMVTDACCARETLALPGAVAAMTAATANAATAQSTAGEPTDPQHAHQDSGSQPATVIIHEPSVLDLLDVFTSEKHVFLKPEWRSVFTESEEDDNPESEAVIKVYSPSRRRPPVLQHPKDALPGPTVATPAAPAPPSDTSAT